VHLPLRFTASSAATEEEKKHQGEIWPTKVHRRLHTAPCWQRKKREQREGRDCKRLEGKAATSFESSLSFSALQALGISQLPRQKQRFSEEKKKLNPYNIEGPQILTTTKADMMMILPQCIFKASPMPPAG